LTEELQTAKAEMQEQASAHQQSLQHIENNWQQRLNDAQQASHKQLAAAEHRLRQQELAMQQQLGRLQAAEQQCKQLTEQRLCVQQQVAESQAAAQVGSGSSPSDCLLFHAGLALFSSLPPAAMSRARSASHCTGCLSAQHGRLLLPGVCRTCCPAVLLFWAALLYVSAL
jgi:beta-phosphoglucomutase-like phosphatase (HAD superfamily)